jgi:ABC-type glutathione transport system ATPase component
MPIAATSASTSSCEASGQIRSPGPGPPGACWWTAKTARHEGRTLGAVRRSEAAIVPQGAMHALDPVRLVGIQIAVAIHLHDKGHDEARPILGRRPGVEQVEANTTHTMPRR